MSQSAQPSPITLTVAEIAGLVNGEVRGDGSVTIKGVAPIHQAEAAEIGMLFDRDYLEHLDDSQAGAVLVSEELSDFVAADRSCVIVSDARQALAPLLERFHPPEPAERGITAGGPEYAVDPARHGGADQHPRVLWVGNTVDRE